MLSLCMTMVQKGTKVRPGRALQNHIIGSSPTESEAVGTRNLSALFAQSQVSTIWGATPEGTVVLMHDLRFTRAAAKSSFSNVPSPGGGVASGRPLRSVYIDCLFKADDPWLILTRLEHCRHSEGDGSPKL
jgi:hypothetical protein